MACSTDAGSPSIANRVRVKSRCRATRCRCRVNSPAIRGPAARNGLRMPTPWARSIASVIAANAADSRCIRSAATAARTLASTTSPRNGSAARGIGVEQVQRGGGLIQHQSGLGQDDAFQGRDESRTSRRPPMRAIAASGSPAARWASAWATGTTWPASAGGHPDLGPDRVQPRGCGTSRSRVLRGRPRPRRRRCPGQPGRRRRTRCG